MVEKKRRVSTIGGEIQTEASASSMTVFFFFQQETANEVRLSLVGSEMCKRGRGSHCEANSHAWDRDFFRSLGKVGRLPLIHI